jgi:pyruvate formate lyase activating enzyme
MENNEKQAFIYSIQHYCIHDGPGIRTTVFFKGCQMQCAWCANPESKSSCQEIAFFAGKCKMCGQCIEACRYGALDLTSRERIDRSKCTLCGDCVYVCPNDAYRIFGEYMSLDELVDEVMKDRKFYRKSGGGVTVSGGEPSTQAEFITAFLSELKRLGVHTAMETNGHMADVVLDRLIPVVDLFLYDIKQMDPVKHEKYTGVGNQQVLDNIRRLTLEHKVPVTMRVPLIPGVNDDEHNLTQTAQLAAMLSKGSLTGVHLLKFHNMAAGKYTALNTDYDFARTDPQTDLRLEEIRQLFESYGVKTQIGG